MLPLKDIGSILQGSPMVRISKEIVPDYAIDIFEKINPYYKHLNDDFQQELRKYMLHLSSKILEGKDVEEPDEFFEDLLASFEAARKRISN